jgi:hypothetical protein
MRTKEIQVIYAWIYLLLFCLIEKILYSFELENYPATQFIERSVKTNAVPVLCQLNDRHYTSCNLTDEHTCKMHTRKA